MNDIKSSGRAEVDAVGWVTTFILALLEAKAVQLFA